MELFHRLKWRVGFAIVFVVAALTSWLPLAQWTGEPIVARIIPALAAAFWIDVAITVGRTVFEPSVDFADLVRDAVARGNAHQMAWLIKLEQLFYVALVAGIAYAT